MLGHLVSLLQPKSHLVLGLSSLPLNDTHILIQPSALTFPLTQLSSSNPNYELISTLSSSISDFHLNKTFPKMHAKLFLKCFPRMLPGRASKGSKLLYLVSSLFQCLIVLHLGSIPSCLTRISLAGDKHIVFLITNEDRNLFPPFSQHLSVHKDWSHIYPWFSFL